MILLDASGLFSAIDDSQPAHPSCRGVLERDTGPLLLSPFVLAELDYLVSTRVGISAELALLDEVTRGTYETIAFSDDDFAQARAVIDRYRDLGVGLADASIVVLAGKLGTDRILTLDERHFRVLRTPAGRPFTVLPADA